MLIRLRGNESLTTWFKREVQEACAHRWLTGCVIALRWDPEFEDYRTGPTWRQVCMRCELVIDRFVPSRQLKPLIAQNAPSPNWLARNGFVNWHVEEVLIGDDEEGATDQQFSRYERDQTVRATVRQERLVRR